MPNPYKYFFNEETQTYQFITKNDFTYSIAFIEDGTLDSLSNDNIELKDIYQIVIEKVEDTKEPLDANVSCTINQIIFDFFTNFQNVIIYIYVQMMIKKKFSDSMYLIDGIKIAIIRI